MKSEKIEMGKNEEMIRFRDLNDNGIELLDKHFEAIKYYNEIEGIAIVEEGLYIKLKYHGTNNKKLFKYKKSTIKKKLKLDGWKNK